MHAHDMSNFVSAEIDMEAAVAPELAHDHGGHGDSSHAGHGHDAGHQDDHGHGGVHAESHGEGHSTGHGTGHGVGHERSRKTSESHGEGHSAGHGTEHGVGHEPKLKKSRHDSRVNSFAIVREGEIYPERLSMWMRHLGNMKANRGTIFRIKAILALKGSRLKRVVHAVMDATDEDDIGPWADGEKKICKIVFIGKALDEEFLRRGFEAIFVKSVA